MSWQIALMVASTATGAWSAANEARAAEEQALLQEQAFREEADLARIQAEQQEVERRREFAILEAENDNLVGYDPHTSPSFMAIAKDNEAQLDKDIANIQLVGRQTVRKLTQSAQASKITARSARQARMLTLATGIAKGGAQIGRYSGGSGSQGGTTGTGQTFSSAGFDSGAELTGGL